MPFVVSDAEKAHRMRQVGIGKASVSSSPRKCRNQFQLASKLGRARGPRMSLADTRLLARWCPACRRASPVCGFHVERGRAGADNAVRRGVDGERERVKRQKPRGAEYRRGTRIRTGP
jgi:hypothetical protein